MKIASFLFCALIAGVTAFPKFATKDDEPTCGYSNCPKPDPNKLNIHIVPHSHDDVGWLKTVDQYYYGSKNNVQKAGVQYILDSVVEALLQNRKRRFIYVETAFFWKWWQEKSDEVRDQVRYLINNGQLEMTGGGWSMNDEAAVHYQSTIDQFTLGFKKLYENLGKCARPKVGWQIDPFGHSREMASIFAQFGFDGMFFARLDWRDKSNRLTTRTAEMLWNGSQNLGESSQLFTSVLYNHYSAPPGFCFDVLCTDDPIIDNKNSAEYNSEKKAKDFLKFAQIQSKYYQTNNIIITMGDDFNYQDALSYFSNLDKLITAVNALDSNATIFYSSPSCYLKAVNQANIKWSEKTDDFFPYASDPHAYWNGYFTSRPTSKRFERLGNNFLQISKQLAALSLVYMYQDIEPLKEAIGIMQHHDAITGTEKQNVADDYARIVNEAIHLAVNQTGGLYQPCLMLNVSQCEHTERKDQVEFIVYNPLSRTISQYVRIPVTDGTYKITFSGNTLQTQMVPIFDVFRNMPGRISAATHEIVFRAENLPPIGFKRYYLTRTSSNHDATSNKSKTNKKYKLNFQNGVLNSINDFKLYQNFFYYRGAVGNNAEFKNRSSGAYIFRPDTNDAIVVSPNADLEVFDGPIVTEYHQKFGKWVGQIIRVYEEENHVEFNWVVGPIPLTDNYGKEVVTIFSSDLKSEGIFYTDSNGREMMKRQRSHRETFNLTHEEPIAENYYPVTAKITIKDENTNEQLSVLNDRAQGGSSIKDGEIELMVHRRLLRDDAFGVGEALNENAFGNGLVATGKHYVVLGKNTNDNKVVAVEKELAPRVLLEPQPYFLNVNSQNRQSTRLSNKANDENLPGLSRSLPPNVQILSFEPWSENEILLRLEHIFEKNEDPKLSLPTTVALKDLFTAFQIIGIKEMSLGANYEIDEVSRLKWTPEANKIHKNKDTTMNDNENVVYTINLEPMQIRTFIIEIAPKNDN